MPKGNLTDAKCRSVSTDKAQETWWDQDVTGLGLRVSGKTGRKVWVLRFRSPVTDKRRRMTLARYDNGVMSLKDARIRARELLGKVARGEDPALAEKRRREAVTVRELADSYMETAASELADNTVQLHRWKLDRDILPRIGDLPAREVDRAAVHRVLDPILGRGSRVQANRTLSTIRNVLEHGVDRGHLETNVAKEVKRPAGESPRRRSLDAGELLEVWKALEPEPPVTAAVFRLRIATGQRGTEIRAMRHDDLRGGVWRIPPAVHKVGEGHEVPISSFTRRVLDRIEPFNRQSDYVFPSPQGGQLSHLGSALTRIRDRAGIDDWQARDLRRSVATGMVRTLKIPRVHVSAVLGHTIGDTTDIYLDYDWMEEKRRALELWGQWLAWLTGD